MDVFEGGWLEKGREACWEGERCGWDLKRTKVMNGEGAGGWWIYGNLYIDEE